MNSWCAIKSTSLSVITFILFHLPVNGQKKNKKLYTDGYIIRFSDTIRCKIFTGFESDEIGYEITFHYGDWKLITYHPGSVVKGFGIFYKTGVVHYYQIPVPEYWINEQSNNKAYAKMVSYGQVTLYEFTKVKKSRVLVPIIVGPVIGAIVSDKEINNYFVKISGEDSFRILNYKRAFGEIHFEREDILKLVKDRPQVLATLPTDKFIYIGELRIVLNNYNTWYRKKEDELKKKAVQGPLTSFPFRLH